MLTPDAERVDFHADRTDVHQVIHEVLVLLDREHGPFRQLDAELVRIGETGSRIAQHDSGIQPGMACLERTATADSLDFRAAEIRRLTDGHVVPAESARAP